MNNISFGQKIPITQYKVLDKSLNKTFDAVLYKFDGKDSEDVEYFKNLGKSWKYKGFFTADIIGNFKLQNIFKQYQDKHNNIAGNDIHINSNIYAAELKDGLTIGLCETNSNSSAVELLECAPREKY